MKWPTPKLRRDTSSKNRHSLGGRRSLAVTTVTDFLRLEKLFIERFFIQRDRADFKSLLYPFQQSRNTNISIQIHGGWPRINYPIILL